MTIEELTAATIAIQDPAAIPAKTAAVSTEPAPLPVEPARDYAVGEKRALEEPLVTQTQKPNPQLQTYLDLVVKAIRAAKSHNGTSNKALQKSLKDQLSSQYDAETLKSALKMGVDSGLLTKVKQSFLVTGESYPDLSDKVSWTVIAPGEGTRKVKKFDRIEIKYKGSLVSTGAVFDEDDLLFTVDGGTVIRGFDHGVLGMLVGEKRSVQVPASLGYGKRGSAPDIGPNEDLHFEIELLTPSPMAVTAVDFFTWAAFCGLGIPSFYLWWTKASRSQAFPTLLGSFVYHVAATALIIKATFIDQNMASPGPLVDPAMGLGTHQEQMKTNGVVGSLVHGLFAAAFFIHLFPGAAKIKKQ
ncbi:hypothetical protein HDV03_001885 [Kappamyces sp. JEL0829]|nr:hypothetical protein HDV03_001885 [Kappamyces sp. JEL0829]